MFCNKCGNEIKEGDKFCSKCGNEVENIQELKNKSNNKEAIPQGSFRTHFSFGILLTYTIVAFLVGGVISIFIRSYFIYKYFFCNC